MSDVEFDLNFLPKMKDDWDDFCPCHASNSTIGTRLALACELLQKHVNSDAYVAAFLEKMRKEKLFDDSSTKDFMMSVRFGVFAPKPDTDGGDHD